MSNLKINKINISNLLGIEEMELTPEGNVIQILGHNASGKSSVLESIKDSLGISDYTALLRNGCDKGSVTLDLGDMVLSKTHTGKGGKVSLKGRVAGTGSMSNISSPAAVIKKLINPNSVNPLSLLSAKPKELLDVVLSSIPMQVDADMIAGITSEPYKSTGEHALIEIAKIHKSIFEERTGLNRDLKTAKTTMEQLEGTLPSEIPNTTDIESEIARNQEAIEKVTSNARKAARAVRSEYTDKINELEIQAESIEEEISELQYQLTQIGNKLDVLENERDIKAEAASDKELDKSRELQDRNTQLSKQMSELGVYSNTLKQVKSYQSQVRNLQHEANAATSSIEALQAYKQSLCDDLPIDGLEITDGRLSFNGVPFETLNTASKVKLVIELAKLGAGDLGVVIIDNSENLDSKSYAEFIKQAKKTDLQFIVARVEDCDLQVS
jgi:chromosome segregation ATPase